MGRIISLITVVILSQFRSTRLFLHTPNNIKSSGFLMFSKGIKMGHWRKIG